MLLKNLYDSHVHLLATGQVACELDLSGLRGLADLSSLRPEKKHERGGWLVGFGWDENRWFEKRKPTRHDLDAIFPDQPVYFVRCDGHSGWVNSKGLEKLGWLGQGLNELPDPPGGQILRDEQGLPSGVLTEMAHMAVYEKLPPFGSEQVSSFLRSGIETFHRAGFTHIRDMGGDELQWDVSAQMEDRQDWNLYVDWNFTCEGLHDFDRALKQAQAARRAETPLRKVKAIKFYFDGSLGSDTAFLSQPYAHRSESGHGITCWPEADVTEAIRRSWEQGFEVAVHTIGDAAADRIVDLARAVSAKGLGGRLNLEHAEILRASTIQKMKPLHVVCHLQPCHWLSDRRWLNEKLGSLASSAFPWEALRRARIPFSFGSDSPIERPSLWDNLRALKESSVAGIPALGEEPLRFHLHPDPTVPVGETLFEGETVQELRLQGRTIYSR